MRKPPSMEFRIVAEKHNGRWFAYVVDRQGNLVMNNDIIIGLFDKVLEYNEEVESYFDNLFNGE